MVMLLLLRDFALGVIIVAILTAELGVPASALAPWYFPLIVADFAIRVLTA